MKSDCPYSLFDFQMLFHSMSFNLIRLVLIGPLLHYCRSKLKISVWILSCLSDIILPVLDIEEQIEREREQTPMFEPAFSYPTIYTGIKWAYQWIEGRFKIRDGWEVTLVSQFDSFSGAPKWKEKITRWKKIEVINDFPGSMLSPTAARCNRC